MSTRVCIQLCLCLMRPARCINTNSLGRVSEVLDLDGDRVMDANHWRYARSYDPATALLVKAKTARSPDGIWQLLGLEPSGASLQNTCKDLEEDIPGHTSAFSDIANMVIYDDEPLPDFDSMGNAFPAQFLAGAIAVLAQVPYVKIPNTGSDQQHFFHSMSQEPYVPREEHGNATEAAMAVKQVCKCANDYVHLCEDGDVWRAFQEYFRPRLRNALNLVDIRQRYIYQDVDLTVHIRCGDVLHYHEHSEYGYLGLSAYKAILSGWQGQASLNIRILTSPMSGTDRAAEKDATEAAICVPMVKQLKELLEHTFYPADVVVDDFSDIDEAWRYMVFAKRTLCNPSTFCMWPTMAADQGFFADTPLFFNAAHPDLQGVTHLIGKPFLDMPTIIDGAYQAEEIVRWISEN